MSNTRPTQLLVLDPDDTLTFRGPFDKKCNADLELTNPTPYSICYKIKTTASRRYCVKPKVGMMLPYSRQIINFRLKGEKGDPLDKFKVISSVVPPNAGSDLNQMWDYINEATTMQSKMKVAFTEVTKGGMLQSVPLEKKRQLPLIIGSLLSILTGVAIMFYLTKINV